MNTSLYSSLPLFSFNFYRLCLVGHASAPVFGHSEQSSEPTSIGAVMEPGAWKPNIKDERQIPVEDDPIYEPDSWTPGAQPNDKKS